MFSTVNPEMIAKAHYGILSNGYFRVRNIGMILAAFVLKDEAI